MRNATNANASEHGDEKRSIAQLHALHDIVNSDQ